MCSVPTALRNSVVKDGIRWGPNAIPGADSQIAGKPGGSADSGSDVSRRTVPPPMLIYELVWTCFLTAEGQLNDCQKFVIAHGLAQVGFGASF